MDMQKLDREKIAAIYEEYLIEDFPPSELKPLEVILDSEAAGTYAAYGFYEDNNLMAYACLCGAANAPDLPVLLDYFAVVKEHRGEGYGSTVLSMLQKEVPQGMIIEAEAVSTAETEEEFRTRQRRIAFYERNGSVRQNFETTLFHVRYTILLLGGTPNANARQNIESVYRDMLEPRFNLADVLTFHDNI